MVCPLYARTHVWKGTESNLFSDPRNWRGGSPAGDPEAELVFPDAVRQSLVNDLEGLMIQRMTFEVDGYRIEGRPIALTEGAEIESRDAVIAAELRFGGEVVESPAGGFTRYSRKEGHAAHAAIRSDAEPSGAITFHPSGEGADARVTPGAETAWLIMSRFSFGSSTQGNYEADTDGDGVVRWEASNWGRRKVCVVDLTSGEIHAAISDGSPVEREAFAAEFLRDPEGNFSWAAVPNAGKFGIPELLWVRPGVGEWVRGRVPLYGHANTLVFNVGGMLPIGASPAPPAGVEPGDYFVSMSFSLDGGTFYGGRVDEALEKAERAESEVVLNHGVMQERQGNAFFFLLRLGSTDRDTRVEYEISDADPDDGVAYPPARGVFVLRRGEVRGRIAYPIPQDRIYTGNTSVWLTIKSISGGTLIGAPSMRASLTDDDPAPVISVVTTSVAEGDAGTREVPVELERTGGSIVRATVRWRRAAVPEQPWQTVVFAPGETRREILLPVEGDTVPEPNGAIRIEFFPSGDATVKTGTVTVEDDDAAGITPRHVTVSEKEGRARVTVTLDSPQAERVTVKYQTDRYDGTAMPDQDYTPVTGALTFAPGETERRVDIPILQDLVTEAGEYLELTLFDPSPSLIVRQRARITIVDDGDVPVYSMEDVVATESSWAHLFLSATPAPQVEGRLGARIVPGTATAGADFDDRVEGDGFNSQVRMRAYEGYAFLYVNIKYDRLVEEDETFVVEVFDSDNPSHVIASATVTVQDETVLLPVLTITDASVSEGKTASFTVSLSAPSIFSVSFRLRTVGDTAESNVDFKSLSQVYSFPPGQTSMIFHVKTLEDSLAESHETFGVELMNPANARTEDAVGRGRIFDDDDPEEPVLAVSNVSVAEGAGVARFTMTLERALSRRTLVSFATADGTAVAGEDYLASTGTLTFEVGETSKTVDIAVVNDARYEEGETFTLRLINGPEATATILDDDTKTRTRAVRH